MASGLYTFCFEFSPGRDGVGWGEVSAMEDIHGLPDNRCPALPPPLDPPGSGGSCYRHTQGGGCVDCSFFNETRSLLTKSCVALMPNPLTVPSTQPLPVFQELKQGRVA